MEPLDYQNEHLPALASLVQSTGLEFSAYTRQQAYSIIGICNIATDPDKICNPLDIAEPGLTQEYLKKFKRIVLRFHPDKCRIVSATDNKAVENKAVENKANAEDLFRLFRHAYAYFKSSVKNRERISVIPVSSEYKSSEFADLADAIVPVNQPFDQAQFNRQYDAKFAKEDADNHGWWRAPDTGPRGISTEYHVSRYVTPEEVMHQASQGQLVVRKTTDAIIPANMDDGYFTAASSSKLQYDDIRKVYHDKVWSTVNEQELGHLIIQDVCREYNIRRKNQYTH